MACRRLPFLDTDLGRGTFALTLEDFSFFVEEHGLDARCDRRAPAVPHHLLIRDGAQPGHDTSAGHAVGGRLLRAWRPCAEFTVRYVVIQFLEFGGDHLDQLMRPALCTSDGARDIVARSRALLESATKVVYFVNGASLAVGLRSSAATVKSTAAQKRPRTEHPAGSFGTLVARLDFLSTMLPRGVSVMVVVTRGGDKPLGPAEWDELRRLAHDQGGGKPAAPGSSPGAPPATLAAAVLASLRTVASRHKWQISLDEEAHAAEHITAEGALDAEAICGTLAGMFRLGMVNELGGVAGIVAEHIVKCFKQPDLRLDCDDVFSPWVPPWLHCPPLRMPPDAKSRRSTAAYSKSI